MTASSSISSPLLFISHKHDDREIADVIRLFIRTRSGGAVSVYQSSSAFADAPRNACNLNEELKKALWEAAVVILIYTSPDQNWEYCFWECGVTLHPQSPETKIILFKCTDNSPTLFSGQVYVNARNLVDIQRFTNEFMTDPNFISGRGEPITRFNPNGNEVATAAAELYQSLQRVLPPQVIDPVDEWPAAPFLQLQLSLDQVDRINNANQEERFQMVREIFPRECLVVALDRYCLSLFGCASLLPGTKFERLIDNWRTNRRNFNLQSQSQWIEALNRQMLDATLWYMPTLRWELMDVGSNEWYAPVLTRVRKIPSQRCMQFDIYFYRFDVDSETNTVKVGIPR